MFEPVDEILPEDISSDDRERILKKTANEIADRRLTAPAIFLLESCSPLSFVGSQAMIALEPFVHAIFNLPDYRKFALLMERRENVEELINLIETANQERKSSGKCGKRKSNRKWFGSRSSGSKVDTGN